MSFMELRQVLALRFQEGLSLAGTDFVVGLPNAGTRWTDVSLVLPVVVDWEPDETSYFGRRLTLVNF